MEHRDKISAAALRARCPGLLIAACLSAAGPGNGQTTIDLRTQTRNVDFSGAVSTRPLKTGTALPGSCAAGDLFFKTDAEAGKNIYTCSPANQWSAIAGSGGAGAGNYSATFAAQTRVVLTHNLNAVAVTAQCFSNGTPPAVVEPNTITVANANEVDVTFAVSQSGTCVVVGTGGSGGGSGSGGGGGGGSVTPGPGLLSSGGVVKVDPAAVRTYLTGSASFDFGTIAGGGGCASRQIGVAGAAAGDRVTVGAPAELLTYSLALTYGISATNTVTIRLCNFTPASITPPSWTWNVDVVKSF